MTVMIDFRGEMSFPTTLTEEEVQQLANADELDYFGDDYGEICPVCMGVGHLEELLSSCTRCQGTGFVD